jgi:hypothetical protein
LTFPLPNPGERKVNEIRRMEMEEEEEKQGVSRRDFVKGLAVGGAAGAIGAMGIYSYGPWRKRHFAKVTSKNIDIKNHEYQRDELVRKQCLDGRYQRVRRVIGQPIYLQLASFCRCEGTAG